MTQFEIKKREQAEGKKPIVWVKWVGSLPIVNHGLSAGIQNWHISDGIRMSVYM